MKIVRLFSAFLLTVFIFSACKKADPVEEFSFSKLSLSYMDFLESPRIKVFLGESEIGVMEPAGFMEKIIPNSDQELDLIIKDSESGDVLLDSSFIPAETNNFTILVSNLLNIRSFYVPPAEQVDQEHLRIQLFNRIQFSDGDRKLTFKFCTNKDRTYRNGFDDESFEIKDVSYGELTTYIDLPAIKLDNRFYKDWYIRGYDAETGDIVFDLKTGVSGAQYGRLTTTSTAFGKSNIIELKSVENPSTGVVTYDRFTAYLF